MLLVDETGHRRHCVLGVSVCSFVCCQTCENDTGILKTNEPVLMQIDTSGPRGKDMKT